MHLLCSLRSELAVIVLLLINGLWGIRVEIERVPCCVKRIVRVGLFVKFDSLVQPILSHIAPRTHRVTDYIDLILRHLAESRAESQS